MMKKYWHENLHYEWYKLKIRENYLQNKNPVRSHWELNKNLGFLIGYPTDIPTPDDTNVLLEN